MLKQALVAALMASSAQAPNSEVCAWTQEGTWARYQVNTFSAIEQEFSPSELGGRGVTATGIPIKVTVRYGGQSRPIGAAHQKAIATFAGPERQQMAELFTEELLFTEDGVDYWLPFQKQVIPYVHEELAKGDQVNLLALWVGYSHPQGKLQHTFVVNEFCKP